MPRRAQAFDQPSATVHEEIGRAWARSGVPAGAPSGGWSAEAPRLDAFGAHGDDNEDDTEGFLRWWEAALTAGQGRIPKGHYRIKPLVLDLARVAKSGVRIWGDGAQQSVLMPQGGGIRFSCSAHDCFYAKFVDFGVVGQTEGPALEIGSADFSDAMNCFILDSILVGNTSTSAGAIGLQANGIYASDFRNIVVNNRRHGTAIRFRQVQFSRFQGAAGHAEVGLHLTAGYNTGNVFTNLDLEELDTDVAIDSRTSVKNVFLGGQYVWHRTAIDASAGDNNIFVAPNFASGGLATAVARSVGITLLGDYGQRR